MAKHHSSYRLCTAPVSGRTFSSEDVRRVLRSAQGYGLQRGWSTGISLMPTALPLFSQVDHDAIRKAWQAVGDHLCDAMEHEGIEVQAPPSKTAASRKLKRDVLVSE